MHAEKIIPTFLTSNIYIGLYLFNALTLTQLCWYEMFEGLLIVRIHKSMGLWGMFHLPLLRDAFLYCLATGLPLEEVVL